MPAKTATHRPVTVGYIEPRKCTAAIVSKYCQTPDCGKEATVWYEREDGRRISRCAGHALEDETLWATLKDLESRHNQRAIARAATR